MGCFALLLFTVRLQHPLFAADLECISVRIRLMSSIQWPHMASSAVLDGTDHRHRGASRPSPGDDGRILSSKSHSFSPDTMSPSARPCWDRESLGGAGEMADTAPIACVSAAALPTSGRPHTRRHWAPTPRPRREKSPGFYFSFLKQQSPCNYFSVCTCVENSIKCL